jgi:hypothetical protein
MVGEDGKGAVGLLGEDEAGELVGEGDATEGEEEVGAGVGLFAPAVGGPDGEEEALGALVAMAGERLGEVFGGELLAAAVEEDGDGGGATGLGGEEGEEFGLGVEELGVDGVEAGGALEEVGDEGVDGVGFGAGAAGNDGGEGDLLLFRSGQKHVLPDGPATRGAGPSALRAVYRFAWRSRYSRMNFVPTSGRGDAKRVCSPQSGRCPA